MADRRNLRGVCKQRTSAKAAHKNLKDKHKQIKNAIAAPRNLKDICKQRTSAMAAQMNVGNTSSKLKDPGERYTTAMVRWKECLLGAWKQHRCAFSLVTKNKNKCRPCRSATSAKVRESREVKYNPQTCAWIACELRDAFSDLVLKDLVHSRRWMDRTLKEQTELVAALKRMLADEFIKCMEEIKITHRECIPSDMSIKDRVLFWRGGALLKCAVAFQSYFEERLGFLKAQVDEICSAAGVPSCDWGEQLEKTNSKDKGREVSEGANTFPLQQLPDLAIDIVCKYLSPRDLTSCCAVSRHMRELFGADHLWAPHVRRPLADYLAIAPYQQEPRFMSPEPEDTTLSPISPWRMAYMWENHLWNNWALRDPFNVKVYRYSELFESDCKWSCRLVGRLLEKLLQNSSF